MSKYLIMKQRVLSVYSHGSHLAPLQLLLPLLLLFSTSQHASPLYSL